MSCWIHKWSKWSEPVKHVYKLYGGLLMGCKKGIYLGDSVYLKQSRQCTKCNKLETRYVDPI